MGRKRRETRARPADARPPRRRRLLLRLLFAAVVAGALLAGAGLLAFWAASIYLEDELPQIESFDDYRRVAARMSRVYAADGSELGGFYVERRSIVTAAEMPRHLRLAAVAAEDGDFYTHGGLDLLAMARALVVNLRDGRYSQGASTISQQVARSFYLSSEKTLERKLREVFLARKLERHLTKEEILDLYLNRIYFGHGRYGIGEAARFYLRKRVSGLTLGESALLMGIVPAPERFSPFRDPEAAVKRRALVLARMAEHGFITPAERQRAAAEPLPTEPSSVEAETRAEWFLDVVRRRLEKAVGKQRLREGGLRIYTTLRPEVQSVLDRAARKVGEAGAPPPQLALVVMDARSREVLGITGGTDFERSPFNRAVQAHRQAGSTFKPFVYGAGIESGKLGPDTRYANVRKRYRGAAGGWSPSNSHGVHDGAPTRVEDALARSLNVIAVQALADVGVGAVTDFARRVGLTSPIPADLSAALGSGEVTPLELANAYATLASGGMAGEPVFVTRVEDPDGRLVYSESADLRRATTKQTAATLTTMLQAVVREGTGKRARLPGLPVAGKTGTTSGNVDAWFMGYVGELVGAVWVGHDDRRPLPGGGGSVAAPVWAAIMEALMRPSRAAGLGMRGATGEVGGER